MAIEKRTEQLTFRLRPDLLSRLDSLKARDDRSYAWIIEKCLEVALPTMEDASALREGPPAVKPESVPASPVKYAVKRRK